MAGPTTDPVARTRWAIACEEAAHALRRIDRHLQARDLLHEALAIYLDLGNADGAARVRADLRPRPSRRARGGWDGLTAAELTVVELIAGGLTTAATAERLVVSPRTVQSHLRSAYAKLGFNSRARLAAEFVRRRLAEAA